MQSTEANGPRSGAIFGHAALLAVSWTWCIGMFLPVFLLRDFGPWAWAAFALPNFFGAAAMGFVLRRDGAERVLQRHERAVAAFSVVTAAFQTFFLAWVLLTQGLSRDGLITIGVVVVMMFALGSATLAGQARRLAMVVLGASALLIAWWIATHGAQWTLRELPAPTRPAGEVLPLAIVCGFGFLLCPYLDGTFLRTHARLGGPPKGRSVGAFALAFLGLFPVMIAFTFLYAPSIVRDAAAQGSPVSPYFAAMPVIMHLAMQLMFTAHAHSEHVRDGDARLGVAPRPLLGGMGVAIGLVAIVACVALPRGVASMTNQELAYRVFMSCYGLVFPAYVLIMMTPRVVVRRGSMPGLTLARHALLVAAIAAGGAMFWVGFVDMRTWWGAGGVAVVIVARIISEFLPDAPELPPPSGAPTPGPARPPTPALSAHAAR